MRGPAILLVAFFGSTACGSSREAPDRAAPRADAAVARPAPAHAEVDGGVPGAPDGGALYALGAR